MTDVIISVAHGRNALQAENGLFNEYTISLMWSTLLNLELDSMGIACDVINEPIFLNKKNIINAIQPRLCLEIHFNQYIDTRVRGSETLYNPGSIKGEEYANIIQRYLGPTTSRDRGVKEGWFRARQGERIYFLHYTQSPALIIEPEFISAGEELITMAPVSVIAIANGIKEALNL